MNLLRPASMLLLVFSLLGCTPYEFDLTDPPELSRRVGRDADARYTIEPLNYALRAYEGHLVMRIENASPDPIQLLGDQSSVVDPDNRSHPLLSQTIAPGSYIKLIFPPVRPPYGRPGPSLMIGGGYVAQGVPRPPHIVRPHYLYIDDDDTYYWDWDGQTTVRMTLVFQRVDKRFTHSFTFRRVKV